MLPASDSVLWMPAPARASVPPPPSMPCAAFVTRQLLEGFGFIKPVDDNGEDLYFRFTELPHGYVTLGDDSVVVCVLTVGAG